MVSAPGGGVSRRAGALAIFVAATPNGVLRTTRRPAASPISRCQADGHHVHQAGAGMRPPVARRPWATASTGRPSPGHDWPELVSCQTDPPSYTDTDHGALRSNAPDANVTRYYRVFAINHNGHRTGVPDILQSVPDPPKEYSRAGAIDDVKATASGAKTD